MKTRRDAHHEVRLEDIRSIWLDDSLAPELREFGYGEAKLGVGSVLENRGLAVADTVITNDAGAARRFLGDTPGETITKALGPSGLTEDGQVHAAYTRRLTDADLAELDGVAATTTGRRGGELPRRT